jgi:hypothetical protein
MRLRARARVHAPMRPEDVAWLAEYEQRQSETGGNGRPDVGASAASSKKISYTEEETKAAAYGTGGAAEMAAAAAMSREEGRRLDSIVDRGINALVRAVETYEKVTNTLLAERKADAALHRTLLESVREHFIARTEAEVDLMRTQGEAAATAAGDPQEAMLQQLLPALIKRFNGEQSTDVNSGNGKRGSKAPEPG